MSNIYGTFVNVDLTHYNSVSPMNEGLLWLQK